MLCFREEDVIAGKHRLGFFVFPFVKTKQAFTTLQQPGKKTPAEVELFQCATQAQPPHSIISQCMSGPKPFSFKATLS